MEDKKEYLSEEQYQQSNEKVKKVGKILLIAGVITLVVGFILLVLGFVGFGNAASSSIGSFSSDPFGTSIVQDVSSKAFRTFGSIALGSFIITIGFGLTIAGGVVLLIASRRKIAAYTTQQTMPLRQERIEKMSPTVAGAAGTIGKSLAKGIKEGLNEADKGE